MDVHDSFLGKVITVGQKHWAYIYQANADPQEPERYSTLSTITSDSGGRLSYFGYLTKTVQKKIRELDEETAKEVISIIFKRS